MPSNLAIEIAWNYHEETEHSYTSVRTNSHLAADAQRLGVTRTHLYDDVIRFFSPHAKGKSAIFLVAVGHSVKLQS